MKMPTNEERREVAARLRNMADSRYCDTKNTLVLASALLAVSGVDAESGTAEDIMRRLADLIEPEERTCTFSVYQTGDEHFPTCSACGYEAAREECDDYVGVVYYEKRHCPHCGAKVVQE